MALLESLLQEGKKIIAAVGVAVTLACTPAIRAQRDYDRYPERKAEIALYNMQQIAGQICGDPKGLESKIYPYCNQMNFSEQGIEYIEKECTSGHIQRYGNVDTAICDSENLKNYSLGWDAVRKIVPATDSIKVCTEGEGCITIKRFKSMEQAADFAEAMNIYVMER